MRELTIQGRTYQAPAPYAEGHVLSAIEAQVLNQTYAENLRNNFAAVIKKAVEAGQPVPGQDEFSKYADEYAFGERRTGTRIARDPVETEARKLAQAAIAKKLAKDGRKLKDIENEQLQQLITAALDRYPVYREQAAAIVAAEKAARDAVLNQLEGVV